jgi:hypothetical protein
VPGHKIENKISDAGTALAFPFSGWTIYGYWLNGEFSRGKPGLSIWHTPIVKERLVTTKSAAQSTRHGRSKPRMPR